MAHDDKALEGMDQGGVDHDDKVFDDRDQDDKVLGDKDQDDEVQDDDKDWYHDE